MKMLQEMKLLPLLGKWLEFLQREFHFYLKNIIGGVLVLFDLVDLIQKFFTGVVMIQSQQNLILKMNVG
jgi:hypothetical protein